MIHNRQTISLSNDTLSILDHQDQRKSIRSYDIYSGKQIPFVLHHTLEIVELCLNHDGPLNERKIFFIDRNRDLFLSKIIQVKGSEASSSLHKIGSQIDTAAWNDTCEILLAIGDGKLLVWNYPSMIYVDKTLMSNVLEVKDGSNFFKMCSISSFVGTNVMVRRADGTLLAHNLSFFPLMLYEMTSTNEWEKAVRLCRFVKNKTLWTCLAGMAINRRHLETAEIALAAIDAVDKLHFILYVKRLPLEERKNAELALFNGKIDEAETILLQATPRALIYRAIKLNIRLFRWERALDLAIKYTTDESTHVDTVLAYRERFLAANKLLETNKKFLQYAKQVTVDWEKITLKKEQEREKEIQQQQQMSTGGGRRK
jgi:intraflagellar transport protein 80